MAQRETSLPAVRSTRLWQDNDPDGNFEDVD